MSDSAIPPGDEQEEILEKTEFQTGFLILVPRDRGAIVVGTIPEGLRDSLRVEFIDEEPQEQTIFSAINDLYATIQARLNAEAVKETIIRMQREANKRPAIVRPGEGRVN
jgi:hypothetical protein